MFPKAIVFVKISASSSNRQKCADGGQPEDDISWVLDILRFYFHSLIGLSTFQTGVLLVFFLDYFYNYYRILRNGWNVSAFSSPQIASIAIEGRDPTDGDTQRWLAQTKHSNSMKSRIKNPMIGSFVGISGDLNLCIDLSTRDQSNLDPANVITLESFRAGIGHSYSSDPSFVTPYPYQIYPTVWF